VASLPLDPRAPCPPRPPCPRYRPHAERDHVDEAALVELVLALHALLGSIGPDEIRLEREVLVVHRAQVHGQAARALADLRGSGVATATAVAAAVAAVAPRRAVLSIASSAARDIERDQRASRIDLLRCFVRVLAIGHRRRRRLPRSALRWTLRS
jgi:hypothetical protein